MPRPDIVESCGWLVGVVRWLCVVECETRDGLFQLRGRRFIFVERRASAVAVLVVAVVPTTSNVTWSTYARVYIYSQTHQTASPIQVTSQALSASDAHHLKWPARSKPPANPPVARPRASSSLPSPLARPPPYVLCFLLSAMSSNISSRPPPVV